MKTIILLLMSLFSQNIFSQINPVCDPAISRENFEAIVYDVKEKYFPELREVNLDVATFSSDAFFLQAQPEVLSLFGKRSKRHYQVQLNVKLLDCPPSILALEAILVHEFEHIRDYLPMSSAKVAAHGIRYVSNAKFKRSYERSTDCKVLEHGLYQGLADYRKWVYQWLTPKDLMTKRKTYLTPEEIQSFEASGKCLVAK